jgi:hypothetical protein
MPTRINVPDLAFALFLIALGALFYVLSGELRMGRAGAMGPGYVPRGLSMIIIVYGAVMGAYALAEASQPFPEVAFRPLLFILGAVALFALALPRLGLALTSVIVVLCAGLASHDVRLRENAMLAVGMAAFAVALFVTALGLPIPAWPPR